MLNNVKVLRTHLPVQGQHNNVISEINVLNVNRSMSFGCLSVCEAGGSGSEELKKCSPPSRAVL